MARNDSNLLGKTSGTDTNTPQTQGMGRGGASAGRTRSSNRAGSNTGGRINNPNRSGGSSSDKGASSRANKGGGGRNAGG